MSTDTTSEASASVSAQQREHADPTEHSRPIPLLAAVVTAGALHGVDGEISVAGTAYKGSMPAFKQFNDAELAALAGTPP